MAKSKEQLEKKRRNDQVREIKRRMAKGEPTTFVERNIVTIHDKKRKR